MATDVDVQYFSHLNGLTLGNNWGDLIRLLDKALVTGIDFTQITAASIDAQGDVHITLYSDHNAMLFQVVELTGFAPASFNQKYRIKGVPSTTELILKPHTAITETSITTVGAGKLASLGYEIIFRDTNDVKRVYRAKNPRSEHPFIRVDESLTSPDGTTGVYTSSYAKYAMVGLLEHMEHIDDFNNPDVLQLPFDQTNPSKNWNITGTGTACVRGWSRWYWAHSSSFSSLIAADSSAPTASNNFCIVGDFDAFNLLLGVNNQNYKIIYGCGLFNNVDPESITPQWFLQATVKDISAGSSLNSGDAISSNPLTINTIKGSFYATPIEVGRYNHVKVLGILPDYTTGASDAYPGYNIAALEIPFAGDDGFLRGSLKHICYSYKRLGAFTTPTTMISGSSIYLASAVTIATNGTQGGVYLYLGELE
ncbi:hypothetical protein ABFP25_15545 [Acinetobacter indicus]|jgi:hypothetical protein|uniref:hypothetical protein n=1 Tax=Acinetobacter indicus TaxID=756892 RepID=UPI003216163E